MDEVLIDNLVVFFCNYLLCVLMYSLLLRAYKCDKLELMFAQSLVCCWSICCIMVVEPSQWKRDWTLNYDASDNHLSDL